MVYSESYNCETGMETDGPLFMIHVEVNKRCKFSIDCFPVNFLFAKIQNQR